MIALVTDEATGADTPLGCALRPRDKPYGCALTGSQGTGKTAVMAQSCADDAQDDNCCLIVLDPKRDLADKALSVIPRRRAVWILDLAAPEIGIADPRAPGRGRRRRRRGLPRHQRGRRDHGLLGPLPAPGGDRRARPRPRGEAHAHHGRPLPAAAT